MRSAIYSVGMGLPACRTQNTDNVRTINFMRFSICFLHTEVHVRSVNSDVVWCDAMWCGVMRCGVV
jgi:hypothetical protein